MSAMVFAHNGSFSWDEALLVLAPLLLIGIVLMVVNRRASAWQDEPDQTEEPSGPPVP